MYLLLCPNSMIGDAEFYFKYFFQMTFLSRFLNYINRKVSDISELFQSHFQIHHLTCTFCYFNVFHLVLIWPKIFCSIYNIFIVIFLLHI